MSKKKKDDKKDKAVEVKLSPAEKKLKAERKERFEVMMKFKKKLGINDKVDRMDALFPPHLVSFDSDEISTQSGDFSGEDNLFTDKARKSKPMAFEKITTATALLIKENPKVIAKAYDRQSRETNLLQENVYYENFSSMRKIRVLRKYTYQLGKYGIAYWREYIKRTYKKQHEYVNGKLESKWVYDVYDQVAENINPKNIVLDDACISIKDVNKPANDIYLFEFLTKQEFDYRYPGESYEKAKMVEEGQPYMIDPELNDDDTKERDEAKKKIMLLTYENKGEGLKEVWANCVPLESEPLPGGELSVTGEKWVENLDDYDAIGIGQIIEIYSPIVDDILNADLERTRQIVRPNEDHFNNVENADEADDVMFGYGAVRKWTGSPDNIKYTSPPARTAQEQSQMADLDEEIDRATMIPRNLAGSDDAKTAYQSAQNREAALNKLSIPLDAIKFTLEDAANLSLKLFKLIYQEPLETKLLSPGDEEFDEAMAILDKEPNGERVVLMGQDDKGNMSLARRKFRQMELPVTKEPDPESGPTGRMVESDEKEYWEMIPKSFNWRGRFEIVAESFLPPSKALDDEMKKETVAFLMSIETTDEMGNPVLKDAQGVPYMIDRVRLAKERTKIDRHFDPDKIIVPLERPEQVAGENKNPLNNKTSIGLNENLGNKRPEVNAVNAVKK